jgi:hypothetical protein
MQLNVVETARKYEALVATACGTASSARAETRDAVRIETNALFHVRDLRKIFERVHGPLEIRDAATVESCGAARQPVRFGVYGPAADHEGDIVADQDDQDEDQERHQQAQDEEETHQHVHEQPQLQLAAAAAAAVTETNDATSSTVDVKAKFDGEDINDKMSLAERCLAFGLTFGLTLVMRVVLAIGATAARWLIAALHWLVLSIVWWSMTVLLPEAVALVVDVVAVFSAVIGDGSLALGFASRTCVLCSRPFTLALVRGGVFAAKWCFCTSCKLWASVIEAYGKSKKKIDIGTVSGPDMQRTKTDTETVNLVLVHADLARLAQPSTPATAADTASESDGESDHEQETETEMHVQVVMRSSPPSDQHAAMGLGLIDTVDRSTLSSTSVSVRAHAAEEEAVSPSPVRPSRATAASATTRGVAAAAASPRRRISCAGKRVNRGLPYGQNVQSVYLKYETQSSAYARNLAGALATRKVLKEQPQPQAEAARGWR